MPTSTPWVWTDQPLPPYNRFVRFRATVCYDGGPFIMHLTADTRYQIWVNGRLLGMGPVRAWPNHWRYDSYDLGADLRRGENVIAVEVNHWGISTFQSLHGPAGLLAWTEPGVALDWRCALNPAPAALTPRISCQLAWEEQYDARVAEPWQAPGFDDSRWAPAVPAPEAGEFHRNLEPRGIPFLTEEQVLPRRLVSAEAVRGGGWRATVDVKELILPHDRSANMIYAHAYLATQIYSPDARDVTVRSVHKWPAGWLVNGRPLEDRRARLHAGWNSLLISLRSSFHVPEVDIWIPELPADTKLSATGADGGPAWALCGPFGLGKADEFPIYHDKDDSLAITAPLVPEATCAVGEALWASGDVNSATDQPWWQPVPAHCLPPVDVFTQAYTDEVIGAVAQPDAAGLVSGAEWVTLEPPAEGDLRLLFDFGPELVGYHAFEVDAPAGTILDWHNFEFIQPDGRYNLAEGMNNSFRYTCAEGAQSYRTLLRRGFSYSYLIVRNMTAPIKIRGLHVVNATYPQANRGSFASSDAQLDRIWSIGARSMRICAEDTYTDCPTYEQTHWVGDARNEALVDYVVNGDGRLWFRCLQQVGDSLERSPVIESHVPSGWQNLLPTFCFLWMRSCCEYHQFTGDQEGFLTLLDYVDRNIDGIAANTHENGLFGLPRAWNMFDWAAMDCPSRGLITHLQCNAVLSLRQCAEAARSVGQTERAVRWSQLAEVLVAGANRHLWVEERNAYTDCERVSHSFDVILGRREHLELSEVFSQQTQTVAYISGIATGERGELCRQHMHQPPADLIHAGSPYFEFFLLEAYQREGLDAELVDTIRRDWGFMADMGATTFWEMWSGHAGRLTRSHCHGWSAAPTYFLLTWVLGVRPGGPGFAPCLIEPHPGGLRWARGTMPTPLGVVEVQWEDEPGQPFVMRVRAPVGLELDVRLPREGAWELLT